MIKKIPVEQLCVGMYIHDLNCGWFDHPFLRNRLMVRDTATLQRVLRSGTREVYIDSNKGLDLPRTRPDTAVEPVNSEEELLTELHRLAQRQPQTVHPRVEVREELDHARATAQEARQVIESVMHGLRAGQRFSLAAVEGVVEQMTESIFRNPHALLSLTRIRRVDHYTFEHSVSVAVFLLAFGNDLGLPSDTVRDLGLGGLLHDIGKTRVPLEVLNKPATLSDAEYAIIRGHVELGCELLAELPGLSATARTVVAEHHERYDGNGYPHGLKGTAISDVGRMAAIVDVYDANTADRIYHRGETPTRVLGQLLDWSRHHFDNALVQQFIRCIGIYPVGSLVQLRNGLLAVVVDQGEGDSLRPRVRTVYDVRNQRFVAPAEIDLRHPPDMQEWTIIGAASERRWQIRGADYLY